VDFKDGDLTRMPSRLADRLNGTDKSTEDNNEVIDGSVLNITRSLTGLFYNPDPRDSL
jgi:hypothetical protein